MPVVLAELNKLATTASRAWSPELRNGRWSRALFPESYKAAIFLLAIKVCKPEWPVQVVWATRNIFLLFFDAVRVSCKSPTDVVFVALNTSQQTMRFNIS